MKKFERIKGIVQNYHETADIWFSEYNKKIDYARNRYSENEFMNQAGAIWASCSGNPAAERNSAKTKVEELFTDIQKDFRQWMLKPVDTNLLQTLNCVNSYGIRLTRPELDVLRDEVRDSFFGGKIFSEIAKRNGYFIKMPDMTKFMRELQSLENNVKTAIEAYAGAAPDFPGKWSSNGTIIGEYQTYHFLYAENFLKEGGSIDTAEKAWTDFRIPAEYELTKEEKERISKLIGRFDSEEAKEAKIKELIEIEPDILDKMEIMDDFSGFVKKCIDAGSFEYEEPVRP